MTRDLALYIHWPFCLSKCPYCDFNSHVRDTIDQARFGAALRRELATEAVRLGRRRLTSVFFGGGTPSLMDPAIAEALISDAARYFTVADDLEITLEANPTSIEAARLAAFRSAGVNRVSVGIQSLDDSALRLLGRQHSAKEAAAALETARRLFPRVSFDLIYARPDQPVAAWRTELRAALAIAADHLSLYQLTIEPATRFEALHRQGAIVLPDEDHAVALYEATADACARSGLLAYEVSNYAAPGQECRHNLAYWRYAEYAGIGPGAHGRVTLDGSLRATRRHRAPEIWAAKVEQSGDGIGSAEVLTPEQRGREALLMGLRTAEGINLSRFEQRTGRTVASATDPDALARALEEGYLVAAPGRLAATREGFTRLDSLLGALVA